MNRYVPFFEWKHHLHISRGTLYNENEYKYVLIITEINRVATIIHSEVYLTKPKIT